MKPQEYCEQLIALKRSGYSVLGHYKRNALGFVPLFLIFAIAIYFLFDDVNGINPLCAWGIGMVLGAFIRDIRWVFANKRNWPLKVRITDWSAVEEIATGESLEA